MDNGEPFSSKDMIDVFLGKDKEKNQEKMLLEIFQEHNDWVDRLIGKILPQVLQRDIELQKSRLRITLKILEKYSSHPEVNDKRLLPVLTKSKDEHINKRNSQFL